MHDFSESETVRHQQLIEYYESGQYFTDINQHIQQAKNFLAQNSATSQNPAVVFDIDETCLSNYQQLKAKHFPNTLEKLFSVFDLTHDFVQAQAIPPTLALYEYCLDAAITPFFITGRPNSQINQAITTENLLQVGYRDWKAIYFTPLQERHLCKSTFHEKIRNDGYDILLNVGDQERDLVGHFARKHLKLPNPFYDLS